MQIYIYIYIYIYIIDHNNFDIAKIITKASESLRKVVCLCAFECVYIKHQGCP